jgi:subtilisin family serine protease
LILNALILTAYKQLQQFAQKKDENYLIKFDMEIKIGKGKFNIEKSQTLIGIKQLASRSANETTDKENTSEKLKFLGGFKILEVDDTVEDVNERLDQLRQDDDVEVGTHIYHFEGSDKALVPTGEILIVFDQEVDEEEQGLVFDNFALELVERRAKDRVIVKVTANSPNPVKTAYYLEKSSLVVLAEPDMDALVDHYSVVPNNALFNGQWHLQNKGIIPGDMYPIKAGADAKVVDAWKRLGNRGSSDITIAIVDNGFDLAHPDLNSNIVFPYDFWASSDKLSPDGYGFTHGTPCAGVALARASNTGVIGAAPNAKFMPLSGTSFGWRATEQIFEHCIKNGADVISCSWGTVDPQFALNSVKEAAIRKAVTDGRKGLGSVVLFAVGNDSLDNVSYYAAHPDVIAVGASTSKDLHASYSNRGREVTVVAPSNGDWPIIAPKASWDAGSWFDDKVRSIEHTHFGGTSSATPLVAGICALILSANPKLTAKQVKDILIKTADKIGHPSDYDSKGHSTRYGYGRVNADKAVAEALRMKDQTGDNKPAVQETVVSGKGLFQFSVKKQASKGFGVQVGIFAEYGNVLVEAEKLEKAFNQPIIINISEANGKTVYRVCVGAFAASSQATQLQQLMKSKGVNGFIKDLSTLQ